MNELEMLHKQKDQLQSELYFLSQQIRGLYLRKQELSHQLDEVNGLIHEHRVKEEERWIAARTTWYDR